jgi:hypothetical protein
MLIASDGSTYVVKFANNPQSLRILANEWLACSIGREIGLTIPEPAILYVPAKLVECTLVDLRILDPNDAVRSHGSCSDQIHFANPEYPRRSLRQRPNPIRRG